MAEGITALLVAAALAAWSTVLLSRANPQARLPWLLGPPKVPAGTKLLRIVAGVAGGFGAVRLGHVIGNRTLVTILAAAAVAVVVQVRHNNRLSRRHCSCSAAPTPVP